MEDFLKDINVLIEMVLEELEFYEERLDFQGICKNVYKI